MDNIVTLNQLLNINKAILDNSEQNNEINQLLDENICSQYKIIEDKKKIQNLISKFKSAKYLYNFPIENKMNTTSNYDYREGKFQKATSSQIEQAVEKYVDKLLLTTNVYNDIIKLSSKLTGDEVIYFINTFIIHKSEDDIAELIGISKTYLQKIKKSCIVKSWIDLRKYCNEDD